MGMQPFRLRASVNCQLMVCTRPPSVAAMMEPDVVTGIRLSVEQGDYRGGDVVNIYAFYQYTYGRHLLYREHSTTYGTERHLQADQQSKYCAWGCPEGSRQRRVTQAGR